MEITKRIPGLAKILEKQARERGVGCTDPRRRAELHHTLLTWDKATKLVNEETGLTLSPATGIYVFFLWNSVEFGDVLLQRTREEKLPSTI